MIHCRFHFSILPAVLSIILLSPRCTAAAELTAVSPQEAVAHALKRADPVYPPLAKAARIQDTVRLKLTIAEDGTVTDVSVVSGHPMLLGAAIQAAKQWKYRPFVIGGKPTAVTTIVEVQFSLGIPDAQYKLEQNAADAYFKQEDSCRSLVGNRKYSEAEPECRHAVALVEKLPSNRQMERYEAYKLLGHSLWYQKKSSEALDIYSHELAIALSSLKPTDAELAYAYRDVAHAEHTLGDAEGAASNYQKAIATLDSAKAHIDSEFLANEYAAVQQQTLRDYATLQRQAGNTAGAAAAEKKADAIIIRADIKPN